MKHINLNPFDPYDSNDLNSEKYRERFIKFLTSAVRRQKDESKIDDEFAVVVVGTLVGIAQALLEAGTPPEDLPGRMEELVAFAVAQATEGEIISPLFIPKT